MMFAYAAAGAGLVRMAHDADPAAALWIDLWKPQPAQVAAMAALGIAVPTLADMEEIELSNRLYREGNATVMTVVLPGVTEAKEGVSGPVTFILTPQRLVTVRHHEPRPFVTYPERADKLSAGCASPDHVFLGLIEDIVARLADHLEGAGRALDLIMKEVYGDRARRDPRRLQVTLQRVGREGEVIDRVRLALLTLERAISFFGQTAAEPHSGLRTLVKGTMRDLQALEVHADFLSQRLGNATDATLGMVNLEQNATVRIVSVVAVLFLPPTLIASIYGMNFALMPELAQPWGYPLALGLMLASAAGTYLFFRWRRWL